ncbi:shikimate dehydrogenase [Candidatus Peregrinibacteria bacterium]|nr:shikimate dehydrogenase [Candidatus Peregrinibacteria bacterium]
MSRKAKRAAVNAKPAKKLIKKVYCVIGYPIKHSLSPKLHNAAFRKLKIPARYEAVEVKPRDLAKFMRDYRARYAGGNVTIPHKQTIMKYLDRVSPEAKKIGAVNTIVNREGKLIGYNTDVFGAMFSLQKIGRVALRNKKVMVLGAGGAARAVVHGLKKAGASVTILNRTLAHAKKLASDFRCAYAALKDFQKCTSRGLDILINTTSVGMWPNMDIIYRPRITQLLRDAKAAGCKIITGDHMFLAQAAKSFELWTGARPKFPKL